MRDAVVSKAAVAAVEASRPPGYLDAIRASAARETETHYVIPRDKYNALCKVFKPRKAVASVPKSGPGVELKKLLKKIGITASPNCSCNARARKMDEEEAREPGWCAAHIDTIVGWLREEATKRKLPFLDVAGRILVRRAIANAKRARVS